MAAVRALQNAVGALTSNPIMFLVGLAVGVVTLPQTALGLLSIPLAPQALQIVTFFITPLLVAALIGMADEALEGASTSLTTGRSVGVDRYVPLLLGNLLKFALDLVFGVILAVVAIVGVIVGFGAVAAGSGPGNIDPQALGGAALVVVAVVLLVVLIYVVVQFFIQFFQVSIVAAQRDFLDGFRDSVGLVRNNLLATFGYAIINLVIAVLVSLPVVGFSIFRTVQRLDEIGAAQPGTAPGAGGAAPGAGAALFSTPEVLAISAIGLLFTTLLLPFNQAFATSFYRLHSDDGGMGSSTGADTRTGTVGGGLDDEFGD
jgi:hypothetical protein